MGATRRRRPRGTWWCLAAIALASVLLVGPALVHPRGRVAGLPGDPAAEVWSLHELATGRVGLVHPSVTQMINVPDGSPLRRPVAITTAIVDGAGWALAELFGAGAARNVLLLLGALSNGIAMFVAARRMHLGDLASTVSSVLFLSAPSLLVETRLHMALVFAGTVPLAWACGLALRDHPTARRGALLGAVVGVSCYVNPYVPLYTGAVAACVVVATARRHRARAVRGVLAALGATAVVAAPALVLLTVRRGETIADVDRPIAELDQYATRPLDLLRSFGPAWVGVLILLGVLGGVVAAARDRTSRGRLAMLGWCALLGVLLALGPYAHLAGTRIPMPNRALYALYPVWRVVGRAAVLVWFVAAVLIGHAVDPVRRVVRAAVAHGPHRHVRATPWPVTREIALVATGSVLAAGLWWGASFRGGRPWTPLDATPSLSALVASRDGAVAEYPLFGQENDALGAYLLRQVVHDRPLLNGAVPGTTSASLSAAAAHLDGAQTAAALALAGVRTVVVHDASGMPGATRVAEADGAVVLEPPSVADPAVATWEGTWPEESSGDRRWRWLAAEPVLRVTAASPGPRLVRVLVAAAPGVGALRFGDGAPVAVGAERAIEVCVDVRTAAAGGLVTGTARVRGDVPAQALGPGDPRRSLARVRAEVVAGRCG